MAKTMELRVVAPEGDVFKGQVSRVRLPGSKAPFVVLPDHAPIISSLEAGQIDYTTTAGQSGSIEIGGGFVEVRANTITVCTE